MTTPAHDAVAEARAEIADTPVTTGKIEVPDMDPDAALEMTKQVVASVFGQAGLPLEDLPDVDTGVTEWERVGGSFSTSSTGPNPDVDVMVIEIVYVPSIAEALIAMLIQQIINAASVAHRGTDMHERLVRHVRGHEHDDGLPKAERLEEEAAETMGGKTDTACPECGADLTRGPHKPSCPEKAQNVTTMPPPWER